MAGHPLEMPSKNLAAFGEAFMGQRQLHQFAEGSSTKVTRAGAIIRLYLV